MTFDGLNHAKKQPTPPCVGRAQCAPAGSPKDASACRH
jgi:hypothetical protein